MVEKYKVIPRTLSFVFKDEKVLLIEGGPKKAWAGIYSALGGHIEKGEDIIACANREIFEESNIHAKNTTLKGIIHSTDFHNNDVMLFVTTSETDSFEFVASSEGALKWVGMSDLNNMKIVEDVRPILEHIKTLGKGELFIGTSQYDGKDGLIALNINKTKSLTEYHSADYYIEI